MAVCLLGCAMHSSVCLCGNHKFYVIILGQPPFFKVTGSETIKAEVFFFLPWKYSLKEMIGSQNPNTKPPKREKNGDNLRKI